MPNTRIGGAGTTLTEIPRSPSIKKTDNGVQVTHRYNVNYADAEAAITAAGFSFGDAHPAPYGNSVLREIGIDKDGPKNAIVSIIYFPEEWATSIPEDSPSVGNIQFEGDANTIDVPLGQSPDATSQNYDAKKNIGIGAWKGIQAYLDPRPIFRRIEVLSSFTFTEQNIVENVARRYSSAQMATEGLAQATDNFWLKTGRRIRGVGDKFEQADQWQYSKLWDTDLYGAAS